MDEFPWLESARRIADRRRQQRNQASDLAAGFKRLQQRISRMRENSLIDAAASASAAYGLFNADHVDVDSMDPQVREAYALAFPNLDPDQISNLSNEEATGLFNAWKGKYFEVLVRDRLNAGERVGDLQLGPGQYADLAESPNQPGWDLFIKNADGTVDEIQLKATESIAYVQDALEKYPDIHVIATSEAAHAGIDVTDSGILDSDVETSLEHALDSLLDSPMTDLLELMSSFAPIVIISISEGRKVILGRSTLAAAVNRGSIRLAKTGASLGVGAAVVALDGGLLSIPASFATRLGIDRMLNNRDAVMLLHRRSRDVEPIATRYRRRAIA